MNELIKELQEIERQQEAVIEKIEKLRRKASKQQSKKERNLLKSLRGQINAIKSKAKSVKIAISQVRVSVKVKLKKPGGFGDYKPKKVALLTPISSLISRQGVATSVWNNIEASGDRERWLNVVKQYISIFGEKSFSQVWIDNYFKASFNYDEATDNEYITDTTTGLEVLEGLEQDVKAFLTRDERREQLEKKYAGRIIDIND